MAIRIPKEYGSRGWVLLTYISKSFAAPYQGFGLSSFQSRPIKGGRWSSCDLEVEDKVCRGWDDLLQRILEASVQRGEETISEGHNLLEWPCPKWTGRYPLEYKYSTCMVLPSSWSSRQEKRQIVYGLRGTGGSNANFFIYIGGQQSGFVQGQGQNQTKNGFRCWVYPLFSRSKEILTIGERLGGFVGVDVNIEQRHHC